MSFWRDIPKPIIGLAPMDGVTDASFRFVTARHGPPDVMFTEFVSVDTVLHAPHSLLRDMTYSEMERPIVAQIYGHSPDLFYKAAHVVCELGFDGLDINMGCPAKQVAAKGSGAGLIRTPDLARWIVRAAKRGVADWRQGQTLRDVAIRSDLIELVRIANRRRCGEESARRREIPVSVKTRTGYDRIVIDEWLRVLLDEEPSAVTIHGRTLEQQYRGSADWDAIARAVEIAKSSSTLILGNGDIRGMADVCRRVRETGVDGALLGRAAQGDPWVFTRKQRVKQALTAGETMRDDATPLPVGIRLRALLEHAAHFAEHRDAAAFVAIRKHLAWYCRSIAGAAALRAQLVRAGSLAEVVDCIEQYLAARGRPPFTSGGEMAAPFAGSGSPPCVHRF